MRGQVPWSGVWMGAEGERQGATDASRACAFASPDLTGFGGRLKRSEGSHTALMAATGTDPEPSPLWLSSRVTKAHSARDQEGLRQLLETSGLRAPAPTRSAWARANLRGKAEKADDGQSAACLRPSPRGRREAGKQRKKVPPPHSITSSARATSSGEIWRPSA